jgi:hypothetical protein
MKKTEESSSACKSQPRKKNLMEAHSQHQRNSNLQIINLSSSIKTFIFQLNLFARRKRITKVRYPDI